jgi:tyrosine-protein phosphatase SIW14
MPRFLSSLFSLVIAGLLVVGPYAYWRHDLATVRNFHVVQEGVLYRSGQMSLDGLKRALHDYGIRTVITLRDATHPGDGPPDLLEEKFCKGADLNYVRIPPRPWWASDGSVPAQEGIDTFRAVMADPANYPVLIHCFAGMHRTGAFCAVYRMERDHWTNAQAIAEMKTHGYRNIDDEWDLLGYLERYRPTWLAQSASAEASTEGLYGAEARTGLRHGRRHKGKKSSCRVDAQ